jgi:hypothetical protein
MPTEGAVIYVTRNPINHGGPTTLQGVVQVPTAMPGTTEKTWWFDSNLPVTQGDSGGPAFDASGKLLGCVSVVNIWRLPFSRKSAHRWTSVVGAEAEEIRRTVTADQARLKKNMDAIYNDKALLREVQQLAGLAGPDRRKVQQVVEKLMSIKDGFSQPKR